MKTIDSSKYRAGLMMEGHVSMSLGVVSPTPRSQAGDRHPLGSSGTVGRRQDGIPDQCRGIRIIYRVSLTRRISISARFRN